MMHIPVDEWSMWSTRPSLQKERTVHGSTLTTETWRVIQVSAGGERKIKTYEKFIDYEESLPFLRDSRELKQPRRQRQRKRHLKIYLYFICATSRLFQLAQLLPKWRTIQEPNW